MKNIIFKSFIVLNTIIFSNLNIFAQSTTPPIVGGSDININQAPYQVSLEDANGKHFGGGIILSDRWILSAHHLFKPERQPASVTIHAGSTDQTNNNVGQRIVAQQIIIKTGWTNQIKESDLALIELSASLQFNENVQPIKYANFCNTTLNDISEPKIGYQSGWVRTCWTCPLSTPLLKGIELPIISISQANQLNLAAIPGFTVVTNNMIPFYSPLGGSLNGDSGGPAVILKNDNRINIGVTSFSLKHPDTIYPSVYANVRNYSYWIDSVTSLSSTTPGVDLYLQDRPWDMANEPNNVDYAWMSEDIWVRNQADGFTVKEHQNPEFQTGAPLYVYVRVRKF